MARITEDTLTADLSELVAATQEPLQDFTADPSLQNSIITIRTRAERALAEVMGARDAYDTDQTENKVAALRFADTGQVVVEEVSLLRESLETRLLGGRDNLNLSAADRTARAEWISNTFPNPPHWWAKAPPKATHTALGELVFALSSPSSLANDAERAAFTRPAHDHQAAYEVLLKERLDDKPLTERLRTAKAAAHLQRIALRQHLQSILTSENNPTDLNDFLKKRRANKPKPTPPTP